MTERSKSRIGRFRLSLPGLDAVIRGTHQAAIKPSLTSPTWTLFIFLMAVLFSLWSIFLITSVNQQQQAVRNDIELTSKLSGLEQVVGEIEAWATAFVLETKRAPAAARWEPLHLSYRARVEALVEAGAVPESIRKDLVDLDRSVARIDSLRARLLVMNPSTPGSEYIQTEFVGIAERALDRVRHITQTVRSDLASQSLTLASKHGSLRMLVAASIILAVFISALLLTLKRTYAMLWQSEARLRLLIGQLPAVLWTTDTQSQLTSFLARGLPHTGLAARQIIKPRPSQPRVPQDLDSLPAALQREATTTESSTYEVEWQGHTFHAHVEPLHDAEGRHFGSIGVALDITERKQAEKELASEKEQLAVTLRSIGDGVITTDINGRIVLINKVAESLTGWFHDDAIDLPLGEVFRVVHEKTREPGDHAVDQALQTGRPGPRTQRAILISRDHSEKHIAHTSASIQSEEGQTVGAILVFRDITDQLRLEEELRKASKLESLSVLAGGIAHDFNNILTAILANVSLGKLDLNPSSETFEILTEAEKASLRARDLTRQLLTFAKGGEPIKQTVSIAELITSSANFVLRGSNIRCELGPPSDLWPVEIDPGQITQVIHNLMINATQAMPGGGTVRIRIENVTVTTEDRLPIQSGKYVKIAIQDHGVGIPEDNLHKIFDPFFTTKEHGSGLGLATTYSIIKKHEGYITVESEPGAGTTFTIYLPAVPEADLSPPITEAIASTRGGTVLLMDDEEKVRSSVARMLRHIGYQVSFARDGGEAIDLYTQAKGAGHPFEVVLMDLTIPGGMGGKEAIERLREIDPHVKAIVCSGYSNDPVMANFQQYGFCGLIVKPYTMQELNQTLHRVINRAMTLE